MALNVPLAPAVGATPSPGIAAAGPIGGPNTSIGSGGGGAPATQSISGGPTASSNPINGTVTRYTNSQLPTPTPVTPAGSPNNPSYQGQDGNYYDSTSGAQVNGPDPKDDANLISNELASVQGGVDKINSDYAANLALQQQNDANTVGGARSAAARSGTLGSDFGTENIDAAKVKAVTADNNLTNKRNTALDTIYKGINTDIAAKQKAYADQEKTLTDNQNKVLSTNAHNYIKNLATTGGTLDSLTPDEMQHLEDSTGQSEDEIKAEYAASIPADKTLHSIVQNGQFIQVVQKPDGSISTNTTAIPSVPENYTYSSELQAFVPKDGIDPSKDIKSQIIPFASAVKPSTAKAKATGTTAAEKAAETKAAAGDLQNAQDSITSGADAAKVRARYIELHPGSAALYDKFMNAPNKTKNPYPAGGTSSGGGA